MQVYDSLKRKKVNFVPLVAGKVSMYVCGPTVYDNIHIGNGRSLVAFDTIRRYLEYKGYEVNYVSNLTDVDDKIINTAKNNHTTAAQVAQKNIKAFKQDANSLNVETPTHMPLASQNIPDIIKFVADLVNQDKAYVVDNNVYFRVKKFNDYGKLGNKDIDMLEEGASNHVTSQELKQKQDPLDFVLWKKAKPNEVFWNSPWGKGRPGWHIECSVMSTKYLGDTFDIHGGGIDLEFPHHENERAQSEAKTGKQFVKYWLHNGFVTTGSTKEKMSKSLGNYVTVHDLVKDYSPEVVRFFLASTYYRRPLAYSKLGLKDAETNLSKIERTYSNLRDVAEENFSKPVNDNYQKQIKQLQNKFEVAMDNDFNVQNGITVIYELVRLANRYLKEDHLLPSITKQFLTVLQILVAILGVDLKTITHSHTTPALNNMGNKSEYNEQKVNELLEERKQARLQHNFERSDEIRDDLLKHGIVVEDTAHGMRLRKEK